MSTRGAHRSPIREDGGIVARGLLYYAGAQLAGTWLNRNATGALAVQAAIAEWGGGTMGIAWSDPHRPAPSGRSIGRRIAWGTGLGLGAAWLSVGATFAMHAATAWPVRASFSALAVGLVVGVLAAVRDELFLRGFVLRAMGGRVRGPAAIALCGGAAAAARLGVDGALTLAILGEALRGMSLGALWLRDRGAFMAVAANTAWMWTAGPLTDGSVFDLRYGRPLEASGPAIAVLAIVAAVSVFSAARLPSA